MRSNQGILETNAPQFYKAWKSGRNTLTRWMIKQLVWSVICGAIMLLFLSLLSSWKVMAVEIIPSPLWGFGVIFMGAVGLLADWIYKSDDVRLTVIAMAIVLPLVLVLAVLR